jgi:hypothetical protein
VRAMAVDALGRCCDENVVVMGGVEQWWMRDGEGWAGEVYKVLGGAGAWKITRNTLSESSARTSK